jgi:hypothetical protein
LNEDVLVELDDAGHVVSMTIEHAKKQTDVAEFSYQMENGGCPAITLTKKPTTGFSVQREARCR